jgi:hypothetical protein
MCPCADNVWGLKPIAEAEAWRSDLPWVGERCVRGEAVRVSGRGLYASENVGISNEKTGENPVRRKPKVS